MGGGRRYLDNNVAIMDSGIPQIVIVVAGFVVCFFVYKLGCSKLVQPVSPVVCGH